MKPYPICIVPLQTKMYLFFEKAVHALCIEFYSVRVTYSRGCKTCFNTCTDISSTHSAFIAIKSHILTNRT